MELRGRQREFVVDVEQDLRDFVVLTRGVRLRAAEEDGLAPVVVDRAPLPPEVLDLFPELGLGRPPRREVGSIVRREQAIEVAERAHLVLVEVLADDPCEVDELQHVVGRLRRAHAQSLKAGEFLFEARTPFGVQTGLDVLLSLRDQAVEEREDRVCGDLARTVEIRVLPMVVQALLHAGVAERENRVPVGAAVAEVFPDCPAARACANPDLATESRSVLLVNLPRAAPEDAVQRVVAVVVPGGERRIPVVDRDVDRRVRAAEREHARLDHLPRFFVLAIRDEPLQLRPEVVEFESCRRIRRGDAPLQLQVLVVRREEIERALLVGRQDDVPQADRHLVLAIGLGLLFIGKPCKNRQEEIQQKN